MSPMRKYLVVVLLFFAGIAFKAQAQNVYAALHGTVTDSTGSVIPNATVTVQNTSTGITTVRRADSNGYYIFTQLQVGGPYTVTVSSPGFESFVANGLTLNVNDNREVLANLFSSVRTISPANLSGSHAILSDPEGPDILSLPGPAITPWIQIGYHVASN